ncbi:MAG: hypothetical protein SLAVMIC_00011 [uncultured marine phage]|uniref:Uncharacterized protein n=1 Tax=uncultured marine phage TaxID=707152 RepID=A0A8D9CBC7_9VIRU|nr:MAG: hypothetical protein SLAVMIC_00011 [uncultured marine phage]
MRNLDYIIDGVNNIFTLKDSDIITNIQSYLSELISESKLHNFLVEIKEEHLYVHLQLYKWSEIETIDIKQYYREQRLKNLLNDNDK